VILMYVNCIVPELCPLLIHKGIFLFVFKEDFQFCNQPKGTVVILDIRQSLRTLWKRNIQGVSHPSLVHEAYYCLLYWNKDRSPGLNRILKGLSTRVSSEQCSFLFDLKFKVAITGHKFFWLVDWNIYVNIC
jgi:hypothetical protein